LRQSRPGWSPQSQQMISTRRCSRLRPDQRDERKRPALTCRGGQGRDPRLPHVGPAPDVRVALRRDPGSAAIWMRSRAEGQTRWWPRQPPAEAGLGARPDWPTGYGPNSPRSRQAPSGVVAYAGCSCGSRRSCARISCSGRSESGGYLFGPGRDTERTPGARQLRSRQAVGQSPPAGISLVWTPWGTCSGIARI
jgi:hypothetical protein